MVHFTRFKLYVSPKKTLNIEFKNFNYYVYVRKLSLFAHFFVEDNGDAKIVKRGEHITQNRWHQTKIGYPYNTNKVFVCVVGVSDFSLMPSILCNMFPHFSTLKQFNCYRPLFHDV